MYVYVTCITENIAEVYQEDSDQHCMGMCTPHNYTIIGQYPSLPITVLYITHIWHIPCIYIDGVILTDDESSRFIDFIYIFKRQYI